MAIWHELKKRKVFRVAGAYVIVAWLLVQVADIFFPALNLPDWTVTLVAGLVILGFPVAVLLAWAYEITPDGVVRSSEVATGATPPATGNKLNYVILGLLVLVVALLIIDRFVLDTAGVRSGFSNAGRPDNENVLAAVIPLPESAQLASGIAAIGFDGPLIALSPNGRWLVYVGRSGNGSQLYLRDLTKFDSPAAIDGTEGAIHAFFSPDGAWIGFVTNDKLKRVSLDGQEVQSIAATTAPVQGSWPDEDTIFLVDEQGNAIRRVKVQSGTAQSLRYASSHRFGDVLNGGESIFAIRFPPSIDSDQGRLEVLDLESGSYKSLGLYGFDPRWLPSGYLLFSRNQNLYAVRFDAQRLEVIGEPSPILGDIAVDSVFSQAQLAVSHSGTLAFVPGSDRGIGRIVQVDRQGRLSAVTPQAMRFGVFDLSADDRKLAVHVGDVEDYVWIFDQGRQEGRKFPGSGGFGWPKFSRDGDLAFTSLDQMSRTAIRTARTDGAAPASEQVFPGFRGYVSDWAPSGDLLSVNQWEEGGTVGLLAMGEDPAIESMGGHGGDWGAVFSPEGDWLAYSSIQTGRYEAWIRPADGSGTERQLSVNGGIEPIWCPCGEIFFRRGDEIWASAIDLGGDPVVAPAELRFVMRDFLDTPGRSYDVSSDGETLYYVQLAEPAIDDRIHVISNWPALVGDAAAGGAEIQ